MSSTDKRIDDLSDRVGRFEENVEGQFNRFEDKVGARFEKMVTKEQFEKADEVLSEQMDKLDARLDRWGKIVSGGVVAIAVSVVTRVIGV